jgi:hypothetical protein
MRFLGNIPLEDTWATTKNYTINVSTVWWAEKRSDL